MTEAEDAARRRVPFVPIRPPVPFGAWLRSQTGEDTAAGDVAAVCGDDIGPEASPRDVRGNLRFRQAGPETFDAFLFAAREWLAESVPLLLDAADDNLIDWPELDYPNTGPPAVNPECALCGETDPGTFRAYPLIRWRGTSEWGFGCKACVSAVPGGTMLWYMADLKNGH